MPAVIYHAPAGVDEAVSRPISMSELCGRIRLLLRCLVEEVRLRRNGKAAIFKVLDTGYGIPADQQERLFQPFFRARSREVENIDGTGLGLHLVKNIITRHEGEMLFDSIYGQGSTFGFHLPLAEKNGAA